TRACNRPRRCPDKGRRHDVNIDVDIDVEGHAWTWTDRYRADLVAIAIIEPIGCVEVVVKCAIEARRRHGEVADVEDARGEVAECAGGRTEAIKQQGRCKEACTRDSLPSKLS